MAFNSASTDIIAHRRARVAYWRLRRLSDRDIAAKLAAEGLANPETGEPWTHVTVHLDRQALRRQWGRDSSVDTGTHAAEVLAELREVRRQAWEAGDLTIVLRALKQECELLGLDAPTRVDFTALIRLDAERAGLDPDEMVQLAEQVLRETRT